MPQSLQFSSTLTKALSLDTSDDGKKVESLAPPSPALAMHTTKIGSDVDPAFLPAVEVPSVLSTPSITEPTDAFPFKDPDQTDDVKAVKIKSSSGSELSTIFYILLAAMLVGVLLLLGIVWY